MSIEMASQLHIVVISKGGVVGNILSSIGSNPSRANVIVLSPEDGLKFVNDKSRPSLILVDVPDPSENSRIMDAIGRSPYLIDVPVISVKTTPSLYSDLHGARWDNVLRTVLFGGNPLLPSKIVGRDGKEMILVPAGPYRRRRGLSELYSKTDAQTESMTNSFYIDKYPVTNFEYLRFVEEAKHPLPPHWEEGRFPRGTDNHPVVGVIWGDVVAYARWMRKHLPTADEWEKSAFGPEGLDFPWGNVFDKSRCNVAESEVGNTTRVGQYPSGDSPYGVSDLIGNVWEWVYDWTAATNNRMLLGGAWDTPAAYLINPVFARVSARPTLRGMNFGFRLVSDSGLG